MEFIVALVIAAMIYFVIMGNNEADAVDKNKVTIAKCCETCVEWDVPFYGCHEAKCKKLNIETIRIGICGHWTEKVIKEIVDENG